MPLPPTQSTCDAVLLQRLVDAEVGEAARAAAAEHQPDGVGALRAREPRDVRVARGPHVQVPRHAAGRTPVQPLRGPARHRRVIAVQQDEELLGPRDPLLAAEQARLRGAGLGRGAGIREQQDAVGHAQAPLAPLGSEVRVGRVDHRRVARLQLVERLGELAVAVAVRLAGVGDARHAHARLERRGGEQDGLAVRREARDEPLAERRDVDARGDGQQAQVGRPALRAPRGAGVAQPVDHQPRHAERHLRPGGEELLQVRPSDARQNGIAQGDHGRNARRAGEKGHLADRLAARDLAQDSAVRAVSRVGTRVAALRPAAAVGAQPPADDDVQVPVGVALAHDDLAAGHLDPLEERHQRGKHVVVHLAEEPAQPLGEQLRLEFGQGQGGVFHQRVSGGVAGRSQRRGSWSKSSQAGRILRVKG